MKLAASFAVSLLLFPLHTCSSYHTLEEFAEAEHRAG